MSAQRRHCSVREAREPRPAGLEAYYAELSEMLDGSEADFDRANAIGDRYGLAMDWDSLATLLTDHGLRLAATP